MQGGRKYKVEPLWWKGRGGIRMREGAGVWWKVGGGGDGDTVGNKWKEM
jgi:hypothetical protein